MSVLWKTAPLAGKLRKSQNIIKNNFKIALLIVIDVILIIIAKKNKTSLKPAFKKNQIVNVNSPILSIQL